MYILVVVEIGTVAVLRFRTHLSNYPYSLIEPSAMWNQSHREPLSAATFAPWLPTQERNCLRVYWYHGVVSLVVCGSACYTNQVGLALSVSAHVCIRLLSCD
jgi:hypothetical protein